MPFSVPVDSPERTRVVHAIAAEAERRGWEVDAPSAREDSLRRPPSAETNPGDVQINTPRETFWLRVREEGVHARGAWEQEVERYRGITRNSSFYRDRSFPTGPYDAEGAGRLLLEPRTSRPWIFRDRQSRWSDRQSWSLEERLPHLFREIEGRIIQAKRVDEEERAGREETAKRQRFEAEQREREWRMLMQQARERLLEEHRASHLRAEAGRWFEAERLRQYCDALAATCGDDPATQWLSWAIGFVRELDPLARPCKMPDSPVETPEELERHLPSGWSAHGPYNRRTPMGHDVP